MRDWNLPRPLVRWLDALNDQLAQAPALHADVLAHLQGLEARAGALRPLLAGFLETEELWGEYARALAGYSEAVLCPEPERDAILDRAVALEEAILALRGLAAELPRITGNGALDEIFVVGMGLARGADVDPGALLSRLVAGRDALLRLQSQAALFRRAYPQEVEISTHLDDAIEALEEGLGGAFVYLAEDQDADMLEQAMRTLASGGTAAVAALAAMKEVSETDHRFSEDPVLEELFRAVEAGDQQRVEVGLIALDDSQQGLGSHLQGLLASFAPEGWRAHHLPLLQAAWERLEEQRERLHQAHSAGGLTQAELQIFQDLATQYDEVENDAVESMPNRGTLPDVAHLVGLVELMGAVFEERAPLALLHGELARLIEAYRDYQEHLEKVYQGQSQEEQPELERLLEVSEELGEALALLESSLGTREVAAFPRVWEALAEPARELHRLTQIGSLDSLAAEPDLPLPVFFAELRELWRDRLARRIGPGEFMQALARAGREVEAMAQRLSSAKTGEGAGEAAALEGVVSRLSELCRRSLGDPDYDDLETIEELGLEWERRMAAAPK